MISQLIVSYRRIFFALFSILALVGALSWLTMPKEEDPRLKERFGNLQIIAPGASVEEIDRLVVDPLFDRLAEIDEIKDTETTIRFEFAIIDIQLQDSVASETLIDEAWRKISAVVQQVEEKWPANVLPPKINRSVLDQDAIVYAIDAEDALPAIKRAQELEAILLKIPSVSRIRLFGEHNEQINIRLDDKRATDRGLSRLEVYQQLKENNQSLPAGFLKNQSKRVTLSTNSYFSTQQEISNYPLLSPSGKSFPLKEIATVSRTTETPKRQLVRNNGKKAIAVGVVPRKDIDLVQFGRDVSEKVNQFSEKTQTPITRLSFQPDNVEFRISDLSQSLLLGVLIVGLITIFALGLRIGLIGALLVPVISLVALGFFASGGGALHQMSIAAFVLSLGLLVDNVIVVLETFQTRFQMGDSRYQASQNTIKELAFPLLAATGTTVAAFFPMLGSVGTTADFTRSIPLIAVLTLSLSYLFSILVTPSLAAVFIGPVKPRRDRFFEKLGRVYAFVSVRFPLISVLTFVVLLVASVSLFPKIPFQFFPSADRKQIVVDIRMPEGTHIDVTSKVSRNIEKALLQQDHVESVSAFVGRSTPTFFYNLQRVPFAPHVAQLIVELENFQIAKASLEKIRKLSKQTAPEALIVVRQLAQGPPVKAPVEIRVFAEDRKTAGELAQQLTLKMRDIPGTVDVRNNYGLGTPVYHLRTSDTANQQFFLNRKVIATQSLSLTQGLAIGDLLSEKEEIPILLNSQKGEEKTLESLLESQVRDLPRASLRLSDLVTASLGFHPSLITYRNQQPTVTVLSELTPGTGLNTVQAAIQKTLEDIDVPPGAKIEFGGTSAESDAANRAILVAMPIGVLLLIISLLAQFNSFRSVTTIMFCVPIAAIGVFPGLLLAGQSFGFFSVLALLALIGIVVNNGILLLDAFNNFLKAGHSWSEAQEMAIVRRTRPIWLTTLTTVAGLLPLAFTTATLWPPFAWTMIFGLLAAALLSPIIVPAVYTLIHRPIQWGAFFRTSTVATVTALLATTASLPTEAQGIEAYRQLLLDKNNSIQAQKHIVDSADLALKTQRRKAYWPTLGLQANYQKKDRELITVTPFGSLPLESQTQGSLGIELKQSLFDANEMIEGIEIAELNKEKQETILRQKKSGILFQGLMTYFQAQKVAEQLIARKQQWKTTQERYKEIQRLEDLGRISSVDKGRIKIALHSLEIAVSRLQHVLEELEETLGSYVGREKIQVQLEDDALFNITPSLTTNPQLQALQIEEQIIAKKTNSVESEQKPSVDLRLQWSVLDPTPYTDTSFAQGAITVTWPLFTGGTLTPRKNLLLEQKKSVELQRSQIRRQLNQMSNSLRRQIQIDDDEIALWKKNHEISESASREEWRLYKKGKSKLSDVLDADELVRESQENHRLAKIEKRVSQLKLAHVIDTLLP